jgi:hypothetical protein
LYAVNSYGFHNGYTYFGGTKVGSQNWLVPALHSGNFTSYGNFTSDEPLFDYRPVAFLLLILVPLCWASLSGLAYRIIFAGARPQAPEPHGQNISISSTNVAPQSGDVRSNTVTNGEDARQTIKNVNQEPRDQDFFRFIEDANYNSNTMLEFLNE